MSGAHGHSHAHDDDRPAVERLRALADRRVLLGAVLAAAVATVVGLVVLWPDGSAPELDGQRFFGERVRAHVESADTTDCSFASEPGEFRCDQVIFEVTSGTPEGIVGTLERPVDAGGARIEAGDDIILYWSFDAPEGAQFQFADFERRSPMALLAVVFVAAVVALGRWRGVFALVGVVLSLTVLVGFVLPALLEGKPPLAVALVGTSAVGLLALYLAHGLSERTSVAVLGTLASLLLTCLLGWGFVAATQLTGLVGEEVGFLQAFGGDLDFSGLLLAGMVIGALGVLDDVTVTQVAAVWELHAADPRRRAVDLYRAGIRIGRDHIASTVNTLVLAYAGASLPLLLLFRTADQRFTDVITSESVAVEVVRALVGSIGLVASVPITTGLAVLVVTRHQARRPARPALATDPDDGHDHDDHDGHDHDDHDHDDGGGERGRRPRWEDFGPDVDAEPVGP